MWVGFGLGRGVSRAGERESVWVGFGLGSQCG